MITTAREMLAAIKSVTNEDFDEEAVAVLDAMAKEQAELARKCAPDKIDATIFYQGMVWGLQLAARASLIRARQAAFERGIKLEHLERGN